MSTDPYAAGAFCWADIAATDVTAAKAFYISLFDWGSEDFEMENMPAYTIFRQNDADVCGLGPIMDDLKAAGVPSYWMTYVAVDKIDETTAKAAALGATILMEPFDIPDTGRMAIIRDPQGASLSLWQVGMPHTGYPRSGMAVGTVCWNELMTTDPEGASGFYGELLDWRVKDASMPCGTYYEFLNSTGSAGGMLPITPDMGDVPPNWMVYFAVEDCDATATRAADLGGAILRPGTDIPEVGRFAVLQDPTGAVFCVITLLPREE